MAEIPEGLRVYNKSHKTTPGMMKNDHRVRVGVWGKIIVQVGEVIYMIPERDETHTLTPDNSGIIEPLVTHKVDPQPGAKFYIEFYR